MHLNYTDWRDHFDGTTGERLSRMPTSDDPFGSFSMILRQDQCDAFNLTESAQEKCGGYVNDTGLELKAEIDEQPEIPMVNGRLTTSLAVKVAGGDGSPYTAGPGTPTGGQFRQTFTPRECPKSGCPQPQVGVDGRAWHGFVLEDTCHKGVGPTQQVGPMESCQWQWTMWYYPPQTTCCWTL